MVSSIVHSIEHGVGPILVDATDLRRIVKDKKALEKAISFLYLYSLLRRIWEPFNYIFSSGDTHYWHTGHFPYPPL